MTITAADLIAPEGELELALFPSDDVVTLAEKIALWIAQGYARGAAVPITDPTVSDNVAKAYAYHRGFSAAALALAARPSSLTVADGSVSWSASQMAMLRAEAARYLANMEALLIVVGTASPPQVSSRATTVFTW